MDPSLINHSLCPEMSKCSEMSNLNICPINHLQHCFISPPLLNWRSSLKPHEEKFVDALEADDVSAIEQMLDTREISLDYKIRENRISLLILRSLSPKMVQMSVRKYPEVFIGRSASKHWDDERSPFARLVQRLNDAVRYNRCERHRLSEAYCDECNAYSKVLQILDLLIESHRKYSTDVELLEAVFDRSKTESHASPFSNACALSFEEVIWKFLDLITDDNRHHLRVEWLFDEYQSYGSHTFYYAKKLSLSTVKGIMDRLPFSKSLLNTKCSRYGSFPLNELARSHSPHVAELARLFIVDGGVDIDSIDESGCTPLRLAVRYKNVAMVETLLRLGARTDIRIWNGSTALALAFDLYSTDRFPNAAKMIETLLAFGVDLNEESFLYKDDDQSATRQSKTMLKALRDLRESNQMNSMHRLCRKVIRRNWKPFADEMIKESMDIPKHLKAFLLMEDEADLLGNL